MKKVFFPTLLLIVCLHVPHVYAQEEMSADPEKVLDATKDQATGMIALIDRVTPEFIKLPIHAAYEFFENFRIDYAGKFEEKELPIKERIEIDNKNRERILNEQNKADPETFQEKTYVDSEPGNPLKRALMYIELFFYKFIVFILVNIWVFYLSLFLIIFSIFRFVWLKIL